MKKALIRNASIALLLFIVLVSFQNCGKVQNSIQFSSTLPISDGALVCGAFDDDENQVQNFGIIGNIFVSNQASDPKSALRYASEAPVLTTADAETVVVYMNNFNVPTRSFTDGFVNQNGEALKDSTGNTLIEYFGLKFDFVLKLPDDYEPGFYQVGLEADDGAVLKILGSNNQMGTLINNDGQHATQAKCSSQALYLDDTTRLPAELYYYQGPRQHIALRLVWKKVAQESVSSSCGTIGSADGEITNWKIIPSSAFELPGNPAQNPCMQ